MSSPEITLKPLNPTTDYLPTAILTETCFSWDDLGIVAFGPKRATPAGYARRAEKLARPAPEGERKYEIKAVTTQDNGEEQLVGVATWRICTGRTGSEEEPNGLGTEEGSEQEKGEVENHEEEPPKVSEGFGNPKFRKDVFGGIAKILARATEGKDYMELTLLIVDPGYQRRGIGKMLFEDGLRVADSMGLQIVLGASSRGVGLYRKLGCVDVGEMRVDLGEYEGGEGLGENVQVLLRRPPRGGI